VMRGETGNRDRIRCTDDSQHVREGNSLVNPPVAGKKGTVRDRMVDTWKVPRRVMDMGPHCRVARIAIRGPRSAIRQ
jgi:hypothetical protein